MPCRDCGHLLVVDPDDRNSPFCPRCRGLPVESHSVVQDKTEWLIKERFKEEEIIRLLEEYNRTNLIYHLFKRVNHFSIEFVNNLETGLPLSEFGYMAYIMKQVYQVDGFGEELVKDPHGLDEEISTVKEAYSELIDRLRRAQNQFTICIKKDEFNGSKQEFASDYTRLNSEYGLCFDRCVRSTVGGDPDLFQDFSFVMDVLRDVDSIAPSEAETSREFAEGWYPVLLQFRFTASSDDLVGPTYFTKLPPEVNVFHIGEFLDRLDSIFTEEQHDKMRDENFIPPLKEEWVDECGEQAFGDNWGEVKEQIIVSEENLDAHPFLFELEVKEERRFPGSRRPRQISKKQLYYPRYFSRLLRLQIFPMLENGDEPSGHDLLSDITGERGKEYERNLYNYLSGKGIECYHSAELTRNEPYEIDLLLALDDRLLFIELKYLLPPIRINEPKGIRILVEKFNLEIFNEEPEDRHRTADGNPYPEKVDAWTGLEPGAQFTSQVGPDEDDTEKHEVPEGWEDLEIEKYVVSNVVPSYIEKQGVRFMTDLEFYQWIEHGDDSVLYSAP